MSPSDETFRDYFEILEVSPFASPSVLKAAYRALAKLYHPDSNLSKSNKKTMAEINTAYEILSDPYKRAQYWEELSDEISRKANSKTLYFFQKWEKDLRERESLLQESSSRKSIEDDSVEINISQLVKEFFSLREGNRHIFFQNLSEYPDEIKEILAKNIFRSPYLTGEKEQEILLWVLREKKVWGKSYFSRAFRYKNLYMALLDYIEALKISEYWNKIFLIAKQLNLQIEAHVELAIRILKMDLPKDTANLLIGLGRKEWKTPLFFKRRNKTPSYREKYRIFQEAFKNLVVASQSDKNKPD